MSQSSGAVAARNSNLASSWRSPLAIVLIVVAACAAYWPALSGSFLWDDDALLTENPLIRNPAGPLLIWFSRQPVDYWPVSNTSFWIEWRLWGANPLGYH